MFEKRQMIKEVKLISEWKVYVKDFQPSDVW